MKRALLKRGLAAGAAVAAGLGALSYAPAAQAQSPNGDQTYTSPNIMMMAAGSDTTQNMMRDILALVDNTPITTSAGTGTLHSFNLNAIPTTANTAVDGDADCPQHNWATGSLLYAPPPVQWTAPAGSSAGRDYLRVQEGYAAGQKGCVDIGRSSGSPRSLTDPDPNKRDMATFEYYAYALDAVTWATPSMKAPANLSRQNIQDIYNCAITDWGDVHLGTTIPASTPITPSGSTGGGTPGPIQRYMAQNGSGTRSFFLSAYGITAAMLANTNGSCPAVKETTSVPAANTPFEENRGDHIDYADYDKAILPYSAAVWNFQYANKLNPTLDFRNGVRLGGFVTNEATPVKVTDSAWNGVAKRYKLDPAVVNEIHVADSGNTCNATTTCVNGVRYVYNVLDNAGNLPGYQAAFQTVGMDNSAANAFRSPLCNGGNAGEISSNYFLALDNSNTPNGSNVNGGTCRRIPLKP